MYALLQLSTHIVAVLIGPTQFDLDRYSCRVVRRRKRRDGSIFPRSKCSIPEPILGYYVLEYGCGCMASSFRPFNRVVWTYAGILYLLHNPRCVPFWVCLFPELCNDGCHSVLWRWRVVSVDQHCWWNYQRRMGRVDRQKSSHVLFRVYQRYWHCVGTFRWVCHTGDTETRFMEMVRGPLKDHVPLPKSRYANRF